MCVMTTPYVAMFTALQGYDVAAPVVEQAYKTAAPVVEQVVKVTGEAATPVVRAALPAIQVGFNPPRY